MSADPAAGSRQDRRKAATHARIVHAGEALFAEQGYDDTSMEAIAEAADVAVRTIYLHFESKAGILLAYFDDWLAAFIAAVAERPADEPVERAVPAALAVLEAAGWTDRPYADTPLHPFVSLLGDGHPEITGHILRSWVRAQDALVAAAAAQDDPARIAARARAAAVFAIWLSTILIVRDAYRDDRPVPSETGNELGRRLARLLGGRV